MGLAWELFETGLSFLAVGLLLSVLGIPLGVHLGYIGLLLVGASILLPVAAVAGILVMASMSTSESAQARRQRQHRRSPRGAPADQRPQTRAAPSTRPSEPLTEEHTRLDLDVETIDDYRR